MTETGSFTTDLDRWQAAARRFEGPHGEIAYWTAGEGPTLMLLHGFPTASWDWSRLWDRLASEWRLVALDMLGFGLSAKPRRHRYRLFDQADLHERLCAELGETEVDLLAHDYGDTVAQELLARQAEGSGRLRLRSVVYLNGGLIPGFQRPRPIQKLLASPLGGIVARLLHRRRFARAFSEIFAPARQPTESEIDDFWRLIRHHDGHRLAHRVIRYMAEREQYRERWVGALAANLVPQRLIFGALDPVSGVQVADAYRVLVPDPDVVLLDHVGHYPQWEDPDAVLASFREFHAEPRRVK